MSNPWDCNAGKFDQPSSTADPKRPAVERERAPIVEAEKSKAGQPLSLLRRRKRTYGHE